MRARDNFDKVTNSIKEYARIKRDDIKLQCVESLSLVASDILSMFLVALLSAIAFLFVVIAIMILVAQYIGVFYSLLAVGGVMALVAYIVYLFRKELFANLFVERFCKVFFNEVVTDEKE